MDQLGCGKEGHRLRTGRVWTGETLLHDAMRCDVALGVPSVLADAVQGAGWHGEAGRVSAELGWKWKGAVQ